jgi:hypothetical protein
VPHTPRGESSIEREDGSEAALSPSNDSSRGNVANVNLANPDVVAAQINVVAKTMLDCGAFIALWAESRLPTDRASMSSRYLEVAKFVVAGKHGTPFQLDDGSDGFATALLVLRLSFYDDHLQLEDIFRGKPRVSDDVLRTALFFTCKGNQHQAASVLLSHGVNPDSRDTDSVPCLLVASWHNSDQVVQVLLASGADVNLADPIGMTSWFYICGLQSHDAVASVLSDAGAEKNVNASGGLSPLRLAAWAGHVDEVRVMLKRGMNPSFADSSVWSPLVSRICVLIGVAS